jgi:hypothetical protein
MKLVKSFALIIFITFLIMSFQNCSPSQNQGLLGSKSTTESKSDAVTNSAPFAYDMVFDTISYNSCVGNGLNEQSSGIHGLKIGVNEGFVDTLGTGAIKAGLKLRTDFLTYVGKNVSPTYPSTVITPGQIQNILQNSKANQNAFLQYAVRRRSDLSVVMDLIQPSSTSTIVAGRDGFIENAALFLNPVLTSLTKNVQFGEKGVVLAEGPRIYDLYGGTEFSPIEKSFGFSNYMDETYDAGSSTVEPFGFGEAYADRVRQKFNASTSDKYVLAITYGDPTAGSGDLGLSEPKRKDAADVTKAYGRAYSLRFEAASTRAGWRSNLLKQITETNLADNTPVTGTVSWSCDNFVIMKGNQWNNSKPDEPACVPLISADLQNATISANVKKIRRHYLESQWNIGLYYAKNAVYVPGTRTSHPICVVPKVAECYLKTTDVIAPGVDMGVNYDTNSECYLYAASVMGVTYTGNPALNTIRAYGRCAQYASICTRSSTNY